MTADAPNPDATPDATPTGPLTGDAGGYADADDATLAGLLRQALADRIEVVDLTARTAGDRTEGTTAPDAPDMFGFGVQVENDWADFPTWDDCDDWDTAEKPLPLRFATEDAAQQWWQVRAELDHRARHRRWQERYEEWLPRRDLHARRMQALKDAGLWLQDGERLAPLLRPAGPGREPVRGVGRANVYRVVRDGDMDTPVTDWDLRTD